MAEFVRFRARVLAGVMADRLAGMADRFATALDCADTGFLPDGVLDKLPPPAQTGASRIAGAKASKGTRAWRRRPWQRTR